ncbi:MAG: hypothetical protein H6739_12760 [Alphaproteobacteria bacterium]|nr:hypothetical protein [Alphaproteobacteria bacterium]
MIPRELWQTLYERFDPEAPAADPARRAERPFSPAPELLKALERPFGDKRFLLIGTRGTGKTTELLRVAEAREAQDLVVMLDVHTHFQRTVADLFALQRVQPWEILFLVGLAIYGTAARAGHRWSGAQTRALAESWRRLSKAADAIEIERLAAVVATGPDDAAARWDLPLGLPQQPRAMDQDDSVQSLLGAVNALLHDLRGTTGRGVLLVVDGLDRLTRPETVAGLFLESALLGRLDAPTLVTGPVTLWRQGWLSRVRHFSPRRIPNAPVMDQEHPNEPGAGVDFLLEVFARRVVDLPGGPECIAEGELRRLAWHSGGLLRDYARLIREIAEDAWDRELERADRQAVERAIDTLRRRVEGGLNRRHIALLQEVADDPRHKLPDDDKVSELLDNHWLLPYSNGSDWYMPHPLLSLRQVVFGS